MLNKKLMILTIVLVSLLAVSAVSAQDNATSDVVSVEETTDEVVSADENQVILSENNDVGTFDDLQIEIDNATEGSVLNLTRDYNGAYGSRIQLNKNLTIDGQGHTLDCLGKGGCSAFDSNSGTITLKNLKIINGHNDFNNKGGAIYIEGSAQYTIINCTFSNNWADDYGGAIYNGVDKPLTIINSSFDKNTADDDNGGAIYSKGELDIINSTFTSNNADDDGGAIYCEKSIYLENSLFEKNKAKVDGGAIYSKNNVTVTKNTRFNANEAKGASSSQCYGGAIRSEGNVKVDYSNFTENIAADYGGAIYAKTASISSSRFIKNNAEDDKGGAVYVEESVDVGDSYFYKNEAQVDGGAIFSKNSVNVNNTGFYSNSASYSGADNEGGAIRGKGNIKIEGSLFNNNYVGQHGSAIYCDGDLDIKNTKFTSNTARYEGGAVYCVKSVTVNNCEFADNRAFADGGAIYCKKDVSAKNTIFRNNIGDDLSLGDGQDNDGGAILSKGDVKIDNCTFIGNHARDYGGAIKADTITWVDSPSYFKDNYVNIHDGGAIYVNKFNTDVKYGVFINNYIGKDVYEYSRDAGAIYINKENHITFSHCYFENNRCTDEGGAIYLDSVKSHLTLEYNIFINNKANDKGNIVYNKGTYDKIHNNWYGSNTFDFSNQLVEYNTWGSDKSHKDDKPVTVELFLNENPIAGQPSTLIVRFISDGELFNYDAKFSADNGAILSNHKIGNNTVTSDITFDDGITTVTATVNKQVLKLSYSYSKQNVTMEINAPEISFGDNATVNVILTPDNATGKVSVGNIFSTIVNGTATLIIPDLSAGNQTLLVSYSGDGVYKAKQENVTITVHRKNLNIDASAKPIVKGDNATVIVTGLERATGNVTVTINNTDWTGEIRNGTATIIIPGLNENTTANVTYLGDANYINASTTVDIIVNPVKMNLTIIASADPIMVTEDAIVVVTGLENATGNVTVTIGGAEWYGEINDGTATVIVTGLKLNATADVFYAGDYLYNNATTKVNITVSPTIFVWYVNGSKESSGNGTTPDTAFKTLKEALRKAPENSTIYIAPGTYTGENNINLTINKNNLTLVNYGAGEVIFDAQSGSRILTVNAGRINITGLTFKNGKEEYVCGAIFFNQTLKDSYINAIFINNSVVDGLGGAIGFYADVINTDINSIFINNSVNNGYGGAIFFNGNLNNVIISGNYTANTAGDYGGAILFNGDLNNVIISGNYTANTANDGGAIFFNGNLADVNISGYYNNNQANDTAGVFLFINNLTNVVISGDYINNVARFCAVCYMSEFATVNDSSISGDYYNNSASYCVVLLMEGIISNSNISGNYANNHAIMGINILGEAYNVNMCGNYVNNNISNGSAIYIVSCDEYSLIHDSIFINNTIDDELIIDVESGSLLSVNNWFGNNASNYNIKPKVSENVTMANWLFLNATTNTTSEITVNETAEITFKLYAYNGTSEEINEYDASEMNMRLDLSQRSGTLNQTSAFINEAILYQCGEEGIASVTGKFETASYTIILAKQSTEIIINKTELKLKVNESVSAGATLNPPEAGNLTYASSNDAVAVVEDGIIKGLNEGTAIITVSFEGNDEYAPAVSKNITVYVEKRIPLIITGADVTDNEVTIHLDIDGYDGFISMDLFDSLVYLPISSSLNFTQSLAPGIYNVNITALGNYMFYSGSEILTFTVSEPEKLNTSISAQSSVNGNTVTITVDVDTNASGLVEISIVGREYYVPVVNGTAVFINDYSSGSYVAYVTYLGDENYNTNTTKTEFNIVDPVKEDTPISLDVEVVENTAIFTVNVDNDANGLVKFEVIGGNGSVLYVDVKDGQAVLSGILEDGNYTVVATYMGDDRFNTNITYKDFTVIGHFKKDTQISAQAEVIGYKVTITVDVVSDATGFVKLQFGDTIANVELENGTGTYTATLPAGSYNVEATYLGDENYNTNSTQTAFTVTDPAKENTPIKLEISINENIALFNVSVNESATGLIKFEVSNKENGEKQTFYMDVENGEAISSMVFEKGNYTVIATYMGDEVFNTNTTSSQDFEIVGHVMKDTPITAQADVNGYKVTITVDVDDDATGFVEVKYDDTIINIALTNGTGTYVTTLPAGSYNVDLNYLGDENYNKNNTKLSFNIADPVKENTSINLDVQTIENNVTFIVNVDKDATGLVKFEVSSDEVSVIYVDVKDGQAVLDVLLDAGNHTVVATYLGNDRFNTNITYKEFTVIGHVKKDTTIDVKADTNYNKVTITVGVDFDATGFVKLQIGDIIANVELLNGMGTFTTTLPTGSYYVQATYLGDENYNKNSTKTTFTVTDPVKEDAPISLDVGIVENNVTFIVNVVKDATGIVKFEIFDRVTGESEAWYLDVEEGVSISNYFVPNGNYTIVATYLGDSVFNSNTTSQDFEVIGHVMKDTPITAQVDVNGYKVTISVAVDLNATGFVKLQIGDTVANIELENGTGTYVTILSAGSYNVGVTYLGDENYNSNSTNLAFNVVDPVKENTPISLDVVINENNVTFIVNVDEDATGIVKFYVFDIVTGENTTWYVDVKNGVAISEQIAQNRNYTVVATYMGDSRFNTNITTKDFTVIGHVKKDTPIEATVDVNYNRATITVNVDSNATGFVRLNVNEFVVNLEVVNGVAEVTAALPAGSYYLQATYLGDENYNANKTQTTFTVTDQVKENTTIDLNVLIYENDVGFNAVVNELATGLVKFYVFDRVTGENLTWYVDVKNGMAKSDYLIADGNYTIVATYLGDAVFNSNTTSQDFEVIGHVMKDTPITAQADVNGYKVTVTVDVDSNATGFVEVKYGDTLVYIALENGTGTYVTTLPAGSYNVDVTYLGDENYSSNATKLVFNVVDPVKENTPIALDVEIAENNVTFIVNVDKDATGIVKFEVFGIETDESDAWYGDVEDGVVISKNLVPNGNYTVIATYMGDSRFNTNITSKVFTVVGHVMKDTPIDASVDVNGYRVTVRVDVDANATGFVKMKLGDSIFNIELTNGAGSFITNLAAGSYYADLTYLGDENYNKNSTKTTFTVVNPVKEDTPISLDVGIVENNVTFIVNVVKDATGIVKFEIFDVETGKSDVWYEDVDDGVAISNYFVPNGNYTIVATYLGDSVFNSNTTSQDFEVIGHVMKDTPITAQVDVNGYKVTISVAVDLNATGFVKLQIGDTVANIELENGTGTYVTILSAGSYNVGVTYLGDENYNSNSTNLAFNVVDPVKENTPISLYVGSVDNNVTFVVIVNSNATGIVKFDVRGHENYVLYVDVVSGVAILEDIFEPGNYTVVVTYMGDARYNSNITSADFTVNKTEKQDANVTIDIPVDVKVGEDVPITVDIPGATGNVSVIVDGVETVVSLVNGSASVPIESVTAGDHSVVVIYSGDETHAPVYNATSFNVPEEPVVIPKASEFSEITISDDLNISIKLIDVDGNAIANAPIYYTVNTVANSTVTGADGSFVIKGENSATVIVNYAGNDTIRGTDITLKLNADVPVVVKVEAQFNITGGLLILKGYAVDTKAGENGIAYATELLDSNGKPIAGVPIRFALNDKVYLRTTNEKGSFDPYHLNMKKAQKYTIAFYFEGDDNYTSAFASVCADLAKKPIKIKASAKSYKASKKTKSYTVTLSTIVGSSDDGKAHLSPKKVTLKVNGKTYTAKTKNNGKVTFKLTNLSKKGVYTAKISYAGDITYESASKSVKITIK